MSDHTIRVWDSHTGLEVQRLVGHEAQVHILECHPLDHRLAMSASYDGTTRLWNLYTGQALARYAWLHPSCKPMMCMPSDMLFCMVCIHHADLWFRIWMKHTYLADARAEAGTDSSQSSNPSINQSIIQSINQSMNADLYLVLGLTFSSVCLHWFQRLHPSAKSSCCFCLLYVPACNMHLTLCL